MTAGTSRLATAVFALLSGLLAINLTVLQPTSRHEGLRVSETAALAVPETSWGVSEVPTGPGTTGPQGVGALGPRPGISNQRIVVTPPGKSLLETTRAIQTALAAKGYETGGADGLAGPVTQAAILAYEIDNGLALTAEPSEALLDDIVNGRRGRPEEASTPPGPKAEALVRNVQSSLARLGYAVGAADGRLGEATIAAIRAFEKQQAMADTGRVSGALLTRLSRLSAAPQTAVKR